MQYAEAVGHVSLAKVYGNDTSLTNWSREPAFQFVFSGYDKNATDVLLAIEATEYALSHALRTVILCSSDADLTHLARFMRARGLHVIGMGEEKTNPRLRLACSEFRELKACGLAPVRASVSDLDRQIKSVIAANSKGGRGMPVAELNPVMRKRYGTLISKTQDKNWRTYFTKRDALYELDPRGPHAKVRFKPHAFL